MRVHTYDIHDDYTDEYLYIGKDTTLAYMRKFVKLVIKFFGLQYLQPPKEEDTKIVMTMKTTTRCTVMLGKTDCMH